MVDLEVWLIGTPADLAAAMAALSGVGRITGASKPEPLYGADTGRIRRYLRLTVPTPNTTTPATTTLRPARVGEDQGVIDLASRRRTPTTVDSGRSARA